jgi:hypothetical protein
MRSRTADRTEAGAAGQGRAPVGTGSASRTAERPDDHFVEETASMRPRTADRTEAGAADQGRAPVGTGSASRTAERPDDHFACDTGHPQRR